MKVKLEAVKVEKPEGLNVIIGQAHFIKTVEDIYEVLVSAVPSIKFGFAFCESSGKCLLRGEGNDKELKKIARENALRLACGHVFFIVLKDAYPINILNQVKGLSEVCSIFCATANPLEVIVASTQRGRGVLGVIDGASPKGVEKEEDIKWRKEFLRSAGYKL